MNISIAHLGLTSGGQAAQAFSNPFDQMLQGYAECRELICVGFSEWKPLPMERAFHILRDLDILSGRIQAGIGRSADPKNSRLVFLHQSCSTNQYVPETN